MPLRAMCIASLLLSALLCGVNVQAGEPILPLPDQVHIDPDIARLGKSLFQDTRLSADNSISCESCHHLDRAGTDNKVVSPGIQGRSGVINSPTVFNSGFNFVQFWDGRAKTLEDQINGPTHNAIEMASNWQQIITKLKADKLYPERFNALFDDGITAANIRRAIADFERTLITPDAPFDLYLKGQKNAINAFEKEGYTLFKDYGCSACHQGVLVGGNMYGKMGAVGDYFADRGHILPADLGRYNQTGMERHRYQFKVPGLRNVGLTPPYFHDGSASDLYSAVRIMATYQLGRDIPPGDVAKIVAFLQTLNAPLKENHRP